MWLLELDNRLTNFLYLEQVSHPVLSGAIYAVASLFIYLLPITLIVLFFTSKKDRINSFKIALLVLVAWQVLSSLTGDYIYTNFGFRDRPFSYLGIQELFLEQPVKAFPSDHSAALAALAIGFYWYGYRSLGWVFLIGGLLSSIARIVIGFHWAGDVLAGWAIGIVAFGIMWLVDQPLTRLLSRVPTIGLRKNDYRE